MGIRNGPGDEGVWLDHVGLRLEVHHGRDHLSQQTKLLPVYRPILAEISVAFTN